MDSYDIEHYDDIHELRVALKRQTARAKLFGGLGLCLTVIAIAALLL
jgi:hypothetical protein